METTKSEISMKKKAHRRKAGGKRKKDKNDRSLETMSDEPVEPQVAACSHHNTDNKVHVDGEPPRKQFKFQMQKDSRHSSHLHARKLASHNRRLLRPAKVPKAPQNSTQFIIDDHENSAYFLDFEKGFTSPGTRDDIPGWSPYFQQDFENVYRTTREATTIDWTHEVLVEKISSLEERVKTLEQQLSMCDPNVYMSQMQHRIVCMPDQNRRIKEFRIWCPMHGKKVRLRNPSSETSSEDCSTSSSDDDEEEEVVQNGTETESSDSDNNERVDGQSSSSSSGEGGDETPNQNLRHTEEENNDGGGTGERVVLQENQKPTSSDQTPPQTSTPTAVESVQMNDDGL